MENNKSTRQGIYFWNHPEFRESEGLKSTCERCKVNVNVVEFNTYFRCAFCGWEKKKSGQLELNKWAEA